MTQQGHVGESTTKGTLKALETLIEGMPEN